MNDTAIKGQVTVMISNDTLAKTIVACIVIFLSYFTIKKMYNG